MPKPKSNDLSDANPAHIWTWSRLTGLGLSNRLFADAGAQLLADLNGNNSAASPKVRAAWAAQRAWEYFRLADTRFHRHKPFQSKSDGEITESIAALLFSNDKTVLELATLLDKIFIFPGEAKDLTEEGVTATRLLAQASGVQQ